MRLLPRRLQSADLQEWQPRLYLVLIGLGLLVAYVIAFIVQNDERVRVDFVLTSAHVSLIWVIILSLVIGVLVGVLLSQLYRRRTGERGG